MTGIESIKRSIAEDNLAHAYIIECKDIDSRKRTVYGLTKAIFCENRGKGKIEPCNNCSSCFKIDQGTHEDVFTMQKTGKETYKVDDAEKLMERLAMRSYSGRMVGIIEEADSLGETVQNKLLKTLEEPCEGTVLFLGVTNRESLIPTVRSRCVLLRMDDGEVEASEEENLACELIEILRNGCFFHEYREVVEKEFLTRNYAEIFLDKYEREALLELKSGRQSNAEWTVFEVKAIENARMDIALGMDYKKALKRLYLELR